MKTIEQQIKEAPRFCGKPVHPKIVSDLTNAMGELSPELYKKIKGGKIVSQGWKIGVKESNGTHDKGYCIDFYTKKSRYQLFPDEIVELCDAFNRNNFAAAYRYKGKDLGTSKVKTPHIHVAHKLSGKKNYLLILPTIQRGMSNDVRLIKYK